MSSTTTAPQTAPALSTTEPERELDVEVPPSTTTNGLSSTPAHASSIALAVPSNQGTSGIATLPTPTISSDLRHMTSATGLSLSMALSPTGTATAGGLASPGRHAGRRTSQHLRTGDARALGLGSPSSIPSSPTSIHSSSSAIFERDIEPLLPPSPSSHPGKPLDPHRIPRAKNTEQLEQAVPSVLDSAAAILTSTSPSSSTSHPVTSSPTSAPSSSPPPRTFGSPSRQGSMTFNPNVAQDPLRDVEVVAPISSPGPSIFGGRRAGSTSGFASPLSLRSRSPSPGPRTESLLLLNVPTSPQAMAVPVDTQSDINSMSSSPPGYGASIMGRSVSVSSAQFPPPASSPLSSPTSLSSHPPSPSHHHQPLHHSTSQKRLSFMSYSDLLSSTPASTHTLSSLTTNQSTDTPPPHIPSVSGLNILSATASMTSAASSVRGLSLSPSTGGVNLVAAGGLTHPGKRDSIALLDNVGGEWEREGLGRSLEERIEGETGLGGSVAASPAGVASVLPNVRA